MHYAQERERPSTRSISSGEEGCLINIVCVVRVVLVI